MKWIILLLFLVSCSDNRDKYYMVNDFYEDCKMVYEESDFNHYQVYVDILESGELRPRCALTHQATEHGEAYTYLYEAELRGMKVYFNSRNTK